MYKITGAGRRTATAMLIVAAVVCVKGAQAYGYEGFTEPYRLVELAAPEPGVVSMNHVREGEPVRKGDAITSLNDKDLLGALAVAQADATASGRREAAEAEVALQKRRVEKLEKLRREGHSTQEETERAQADYAIAVSQLRAVNEELGRKQLEVAQIQAQIDRRHIAAPMDGIVTELLKEPGESVSANESHVATVVQLELLRVKFYISTQDAQQLRQGSSVNLLLIETGQEVEGTTEYICPITDAESGTVRVEFVLENARGDYRSGLRCKWQPMTTGQP